MPSPLSVKSGKPLAATDHRPWFPAGNAGKTSAVDVNGFSAKKFAVGDHRYGEAKFVRLKPLKQVFVG
jgi:hypothetical protein